MRSTQAPCPDPDDALDLYDDEIPPDVTLTAAQAADMVAALHTALRASGCDNTLRAAERWAARTRVPWPGLCAELQGNGGYCDCAVVLNVFRGDEWDEP